MSRPARALRPLLAGSLLALALLGARGAEARTIEPSVDTRCSGPCWISLGKWGSGSGLVTSDPEGMHCGTTCHHGFFHGSWATLVATPDAGSRFTRWEGVGVCTDPADPAAPADLRNPRCRVHMDDGKSMTAVFDLVGADDSPPAPPPPPPPVGVPPPPDAKGCTITGTSGNDEITGTSGRDVVCALGGNDHIHPGAGDDVVRAGAGSDEVEAGPGADRVDGGAGGDELFGDAGNDVLTGGGGHDAVTGGAGADLLLVRDGARDTARGGPGRDRARSDRRDRLVAIEKRL